MAPGQTPTCCPHLFRILFLGSSTLNFPVIEVRAADEEEEAWESGSRNNGFVQQITWFFLPSYADYFLFSFLLNRFWFRSYFHLSFSHLTSAVGSRKCSLITWDCIQWYTRRITLLLSFNVLYSWLLSFTKQLFNSFWAIG